MSRSCVSYKKVHRGSGNWGNRRSCPARWSRGRACSVTRNSTPLHRLATALALEKAELSVGGQGYEEYPPHPGRLGGAQARRPTCSTGAWKKRCWRSNARYFRFDLSGLATFQYALYGGPDGGHFDWHKDYGRDPVRSGARAAQADLEPSTQQSVQIIRDCDLQVRAGNQIDTAPTARGTLVAFPANRAASGRRRSAQASARRWWCGRWARNSADSNSAGRMAQPWPSLYRWTMKLLPAMACAALFACCTASAAGRPAREAPQGLGHHAGARRRDAADFRRQ